ncbi:hypothetical protein DFH11DRAFT_63898 [Phellopilus nigrolimitatus]|nr:hypothetical protein DFH11DRAFT_63898 [Phellopilus nigrolimitatus]
MLCARALFPSLQRKMARNISFNNLFKEAPVPIPSELQVKLTPEETNCALCSTSASSSLKRKGQHVECRIAGGWVRDKLLGAQSNDIDVALANIMGVSFAEQFVSFVSSKNLPIKSVATIARNPEQSKHLETARTTVLGVELDFVNLRSESYAEDSRIPTEIKLGTPLEDALRRDITMNALFYNVHSRTVEDYTEKGLDDLKSGILRTPLAPFETFKDDPLRVIRCIRFASRYGFKMVKEIEVAVQNEDIKAAIVSKISRERVGEELDKMMKGRDPLYAIRLITSLNLQPPLFAVSPSIASTFSAAPALPSTALGVTTLLHALLSSSSSALQLPSVHPRLLSQIPLDATLRPRLFLAAALTPYARVSYTPPKKKATAPAVEVVLREALKLGLQNHYADGVPALFAAAETLCGVDAEQFSGPGERARIGLLLRTKSVHNVNSGSHWSSSLLFSLVQELVVLWDVEKDDFDVEQGAKIVDRYNRFLQRVEELNLPESIDDKPILNGKEVVSLLGVEKPGVWTGAVLARISEWALDHPEGTKDECAVWLREEHLAGRVDTGEGAQTSGSRHLRRK